MPSRETDEDWTVVHYGKRRRQTRHNRPYSDNRTYAEVAATPLPARRRTYHTDFESQDRQPVNTNRRSHPQFTGHHKQPIHHNKPHTQPSNVHKQQPRYNNRRRYNNQPNTDPKLQEDLDTMLKIITMVHHLDNVYHDDVLVEPPTITRIVDYLTDVIKPAAPSQSTLQFIQGNAKNWAHTTLLILQQHYSDVLECELDKLTTRKPYDWHNQFELAVKRARRYRGKRLKEATISRAKDLISAYFATLTDEVASQMDFAEIAQSTSDTPATDANPQPRHQRTLTSHTTVATQTDKVSNDWSPIASKETSTPHMDTTVVSNLITLDEEQIDVSSAIVTPSLSLTSPLPPRVPRQRETISDGSPILRPTATDTHDDRLSPVIAIVHTTKTHMTQLPHTTAQQTLNTTDITPQPPNDIDNINFTTPQNTTQSLLLHNTTQDNIPPNPTALPSPKRVTTHPRTAKKVRLWDLKICQSTLIIGDSNVGRIGTFHNQDVQIDCYPGANFLHAEALLLKAKAHCQVNNIVLSFGMNSRTAKVKETTVKQIQRALKAAKDKFPKAHVWIPRINFSGCLPTLQQTNLQAINAYLARNCQTIPQLPNSDFHTVGDEVHWTPETANNMLQHWLKFLN